jgi:hypothetical protein
LLDNHRHEALDEILKLLNERYWYLYLKGKHHGLQSK